MHKASCLLLPDSKQLQLNSAEIIQVMNLSKDIKKCFEEIRNDAKIEFSTIYSRARRLSEENNFEFKLPRQTKRQIHRENYGVDNVEDYYKVSVFIPCLDTLIEELNYRFQNSFEIAAFLEYILPFRCCEKQFEDVMDVASLYSSDIDSDVDIVKGEFELWKKKWLKVEPNQRPKTAVEALNEPEIKLLFQNISKILNIFGVLPVTTASSERSFSTLRKVLEELKLAYG
ncbi:hypothetical protein AVEN_189605-1 [Araneus ventricosus]|uniref:HAT C-terminal dimerisation domain-containing protein n=1 Tax=Araneus ventricosus TaxID=182803 RepID=A0A4Y2W5H2_ARAVE|nr:hypothetical protein AVEN_189605-1 [Araneus ventricosus]